MQRTCLAAVLALGLLTVGASDARAQVFVTPFGGVTLEGDAPDEKFTTGASLTFMGDVAGFEIDFGYTPDFFAESDNVVLIGDNNVTTLTGNLLLGVGVGPVRPYAVVGLGLLRTQVDVEDLFEDVDSNELAVSAGAGLMGLVGDHVGLRGDVRYFRVLEDPADSDVDLALGNFDFWRASVGIVFRF